MSTFFCLNPSCTSHPVIPVHYLLTVGACVYHILAAIYTEWNKTTSCITPKYTQKATNNPSKCSRFKTCPCDYLSLAVRASCVDRGLTELLHTGWLGYYYSMHPRGACSWRRLLGIWSLWVARLWITHLLGWWWWWIVSTLRIACNETSKLNPS